MKRLLDFDEDLVGAVGKNKEIFILLWKQLRELMTYQQPIQLTDGATIYWDVSAGYNAQVTLSGSRTLSVNQLVTGDYGTIKVIQGGSGSYTLTLPTSPVSKVSGAGAGAVTLSTAVGAIDILGFYYDGTTLFWNIQTDFT